MVKNPPANAGDMGSSPGPGRSHMPWSNKARMPQLLSLSSRAREPPLVKPAHHNEEQPPLATTRESPHAATKTQCSQKEINKINLFFKISGNNMGETPMDLFFSF